MTVEYKIRLLPPKPTAQSHAERARKHILVTALQEHNHKAYIVAIRVIDAFITAHRTLKEGRTAVAVRTARIELAKVTPNNATLASLQYIEDGIMVARRALQQTYKKD